MVDIMQNYKLTPGIGTIIMGISVTVASILLIIWLIKHWN